MCQILNGSELLLFGTTIILFISFLLVFVLSISTTNSFQCRYVGINQTVWLRQMFLRQSSWSHSIIIENKYLLSMFKRFRQSVYWLGLYLLVFEDFHQKQWLSSESIFGWFSPDWSLSAGGLKQYRRRMLLYTDASNKPIRTFLFSKHEKDVISLEYLQLSSLEKSFWRREERPAS